MSKVIKVKISDIENIVNNLLSEQNFDDFDTQIQPEELPQEPEYNPEDFEDNDTDKSVPKYLIGKDEAGNIAVVDSQTGQILNPQ